MHTNYVWAFSRLCVCEQAAVKTKWSEADAEHDSAVPSYSQEKRLC